MPNPPDPAQITNSRHICSNGVQIKQELLNVTAPNFPSLYHKGIDTKFKLHLCQESFETLVISKY